MKGPAEFIVSLFDLCEAEGRLLQAGILRTVRRVVLLCLGLLLGAVAVGFLVAALYGLAVLYIPPPAALALIGLVCACIAALMVRSSGRTGADATASGAGSAPRAADKTAPGDTGSHRTRAGTAAAAADSAGVAGVREAASPWAKARPYHERSENGERRGSRAE